MADVKIPISANVKGIVDELTAVERKLRDVEKVGERLGRIKFKPIDADEIGKELKKLEQMMLDTHRRVMGSWNGGGGMAPGQLPSPAAPLPAPSGRYPVPATAHPAAVRRGGRGAYTHMPDFWSVPQQFVGGVGGGFSTIAGYGTRGAISGAFGGGGLMGGIGGLAKGLGIGALAFGAYKIGQSVSEGYDLAKDRAGTLDTLKRQMGDVGVSYDRLKYLSDSVAPHSQMNSVERASALLQFNRASRGRGDATSGVNFGVGLSRSYGLDPSVGVGFVGGMANMNRRQNNSELAIMIAEAIDKSGSAARADEVMQAIQGYAASVSRMVMSTGGTAQYAGAYSSLMGMNGMTNENATGILGAANASVMRMGAFGDASKNFTLMALNRHGRLNPFQAMALSEGGLFGTRGDVFRSGGAIDKFVGGHANPGGDQSITNFDAIRGMIRSSGLPKWMQLDMAKNEFGVGSMSQAAALMNMSSGESGSLLRRMKAAGIDPNSVNADGLQALAKAPANATPDQLRSLAQANREKTPFTEMQDQLKALDDIKINTGDKLIGPVNDIRGFVAAIAAKIAPDSEYSRQARTVAAASTDAGELARFDAQRAKRGIAATAPSMARDMLVQRLKRDLTANTDPAIVRQIEANEKDLGKLGLPPGALFHQIGIESGFNPKAVGPMTKWGQAKGLAQIMPKNVEEFSRRVGRKLDPFNPQDNILMQRMLWEEDLKATHGDFRAAAVLYHGGANPANQGPATQAYADALAGTPLPSAGAGGATSSATSSTHELNVVIQAKDQSGNPVAPAQIKRVTLPVPSGANR